MMLRRCW